MKKIIIVVCMFSSIYAIAGARGKETGSSLLKQKADKCLAQLIEIPEGCKITVEAISQSRKGRKVVFHMKVPDTFWTMSEFPEVYFFDSEDGPEIRVWSLLKADDNFPHPCSIEQWFLQKTKNPEKCIKVMDLWFNANRNKGRTVNYAYDRYASAYRVAGKEKEWFSTLDNELKLAKAPEAIYEIHKHKAKWYHKRFKPEQAIKNWKLAQQSMKSQSNSYRTTRYAIPYIEIAKIHIEQKQFNKAVENLKQHRSTSYGKKHLTKSTDLLGGVYELQHKYDEVRKLYLPMLSEDFGKNWSSRTHLKKYQDSIREKIRLLDVKEELSGLISKLDNEDANERTKAYNKIKALGGDVIPLLKEYRNNSNLEIRESVKELIQKMTQY